MRRLGNIAGIGIDKLDTDGVLSRVEDFIAKGRPRHIVYVNANCINCAFSDKGYKQILSGADIVYPDGMSLVWVSYFYNNPLPERVNLGDFLPRLCQLCVDKGYKMFLLGGEKGVSDKVASNLKIEFPDLKIAGTHHGFFKKDEQAQVIEKINNSSCDILLVGMGVPKQEKWIAENKGSLKCPVLWGVGGLFDYYAGNKLRAPRWVRKAGMEWLFRLLVEPARLWKRYIVGNTLFLIRAFSPVILDTAIAIITWIGAYWLRFLINPLFAIPIGKLANYLYVLPLIVLAWPFICSFSGLYSVKKGPGEIRWLAGALKAVATGLVFAVSVSFIFREIGIARSFLVIWAGLNLFFILLLRWVLKSLKLWFAQRERPLNVLIVGTDKSGLLVKKELGEFASDYKLAGFLKVASGEVAEGYCQKEILGEFKEIDNILDRYDIDEVILTDKSISLSEKLNLVTAYMEQGVIFRLISNEPQPFAERIKLGQIDDLSIFEVSFRGYNLLDLILKEIMDRITAFLAVIITLPLWGIIALFIRMGSKGPAVFVQTRVGKNGRHFKLYKFRTMFSDTLPDRPAPTRIDDTRITKVGRFLRRCNLDELPQFLNVLKGEMSLVGPRPEMPFTVKDYQPWQRQRLKVKPGITGLWQVTGRKDMPLHENIEYDFYYINNHSLILDLAILLKSIPAIILRK